MLEPYGSLSCFSYGRNDDDDDGEWEKKKKKNQLTPLPAIKLSVILTSSTHLHGYRTLYARWSWGQCFTKCVSSGLKPSINVVVLCFLSTNRVAHPLLPLSAPFTSAQSALKAYSNRMGWKRFHQTGTGTIWFEWNEFVFDKRKCALQGKSVYLVDRAGRKYIRARTAIQRERARARSIERGQKLKLFSNLGWRIHGVHTDASCIE